MELRKLQRKDAAFMLEWMHDENVVANMQKNFIRKTIQDCERFIDESQEDMKNLHLAIVDENDLYMGTVSLKNITDTSAEFAIAVRACAMGKGFARYAMEEIIHIGFKQKGIGRIYWCVSSENKRAVRFYDKNGYKRIMPDKLADFVDENGYRNGTLLWYAKSAEEV